MQIYFFIKKNQSSNNQDAYTINDDNAAQRNIEDRNLQGEGDAYAYYRDNDTEAQQNFENQNQRGEEDAYANYN